MRALVSPKTTVEVTNILDEGTTILGKGTAFLDQGTIFHTGELMYLDRSKTMYKFDHNLLHTKVLP